MHRPLLFSRSVIGALLSAMLYAAAFPPARLDWLAWVALVPLLAVAARRRPIPAARAGLVFGTTAGVLVSWWFPEMVAAFFGVSPVAGWLMLAAAATLFGGLPCAGFAAFVAWVARRGHAGPLVVAAGFGACELLRARLGIGYPWALFGYSQVAHPLVMQIAAASGPYGPGMLIAAVNALVASAFAPALRTPHPRRAAVAVGLLVVATLGYGALRLRQSFDDGAPFEAAAVQLGRGRAATASRAERLADVARYVALTRTLAAPPPALVVWPEHAVPFFLQDDAAERAAVLAATPGDLVVGGPSYALGADGPRERNSIFLVRAGRLAGRYDKRLLLPFAEDAGWPATPAVAAPYVAGERVHALRTAHGLVGAFLCFEAMYPEVVRRFGAGGAVLLVNPSNDSWFRQAAAARHQLDIASVRAIENRRWLVRAATGGYSAVVDPYGRPVVVAGFGEPAAIRAWVRAGGTRTPYQRAGDLAVWLAVVVAVLAAVAPARRDGLSEAP